MAESLGIDIDRLPFTMRILLENLLRFEDGSSVTEDQIKAIANWDPSEIPSTEIAFRVSRVLLQDFTGVPAVVDLASMRSAIHKLNGNPNKINPLTPVDLVIDHSVMVDNYAKKDSFKKNVEREFDRNGERYSFLKWGQNAFNNFRVVPPGTGICHQVNLEYLSKVVWSEKFETNFQRIDSEIVDGTYSDLNPKHVAILSAHLDMSPPMDDPVKAYNGTLIVLNGEIQERKVTVLHNRSIAEEVIIIKGGMPYSGDLLVSNGALESELSMRGKSLLHSVPLTAEAFKRGYLGSWGQYTVTLGLVLFAFSTAIAWSYYGDRAMVYLFGIKSVLPYRAVYVVGFFLATVVDTSLVWLISAVSLALMALPNLLGITLLSKEMKQTDASYWSSKD